MIVGAHESVAGGWSKAVERAQVDGCGALQVFTKNSGMWREPELDDAAIQRFRQAHLTAGSPPVLAHTSYLINLATDDPAIGKRLRTLDPVHFGYGDPRGGRELRERVAEHLAVSRGVRCDPGCIMLVSSTQQGLRLCLGAVLRPGDAAWMEDPGYPAARKALEAAGARLVAVPVDAFGLVVDEGRRRAADARVAYVTPSHQFPTGVAMRMDRRIALLDWARTAEAWVLEDDYDSEFRYDGPPLTALAGIDAAQRVIYFGTFSKVLFPGLRMGYVVLPPPLLDPVLAARAAGDRFPPSLLEGALADLIASGDFSAHIRRMRGRYRAARDAVAETLVAQADGALRVVVPGQGLHLVTHLDPETPPGAAARMREAAGVQAWLLSETRLEPGPSDGFVLGFSGHSIADLRDGAKRLAKAAAEFEQRPSS